MVDLVKTGIEGFDETIGGGLPDKSVLMLVGESGSHYNTFAQQTMYNHAQEGGKVVYYTVETTSLDVEEDMAVYGWTMKEFIDKGLWTFVSLLTPDLQELSELTGGEEGAQVALSQTLMTLKKDLLTRIRDGRWTTMPLSHLIDRYDFRDVMDAFLYQRLVVRRHGGIHFLLAPLGVHEESKMNALKHMADGVIEFSLRERAREFEGVMTISKLRKVVHRAKSLPFLVSNKGIFIERAERIV